MSLEQRIEQSRDTGDRICATLAVEIDKLGLQESFTKPQWSDARFNLITDPALGTESLEVLWLGSRGEKLGSATLHDDGSFFADYDIIRNHPTKKQWFIEAVSAWGRDDVIKSEARLLPIPE